MTKNVHVKEEKATAITTISFVETVLEYIKDYQKNKK